MLPTFIGPLHLVWDIWCRFVSVSPAPYLWCLRWRLLQSPTQRPLTILTFDQRGERFGEPVSTIHGHYPGYLWSSVRQGSEVPGTGPTLSAYT